VSVLESALDAGSQAAQANRDAMLKRLEEVSAAHADGPAGSLLSTMPGSVVRVLEAMKMEHEIVAPVDGTLTEVRVLEGAQVEAGAVLAVIEA
jgi:propionyl-CoA carboxylase alpha chain